MAVPVRLRLTLVFVMGMAIVLICFGAFMYTRLAADLRDSVDIGLRSKAQVLIDATSGGQVPPALLAEGSLIDADEAFAQLLDRSGGVIDSSPTVADAPLLTADAVAAIAGPTFTTAMRAGFDDPVRLLAVPDGTGPGARIIVVGATLGDLNDALGRVLVLLATVGPAILIVAGVAAWLLAGAALRPVERMRREAAAVAVSDLARRLPVPATGDDLARLATTLNAMLDRLQETVERDRRFVDDASHELRTPLAALRGEIDLALARDRPAAELAASLSRAREDVDRLQRLADDLLVLARTRGGRIPVRPVPSDLGELVRRVARAVAPNATLRGVKLELDTPESRVEVDPERVEQALRNLLENAIRNTPHGGTVRVSASHDDGRVRFVVDDSGPGFPADLLATAFEPFVRRNLDGVDGGSDGAGLGLTIVKAVAEAHGGSVSAENRPGGARVTLDVRG